MTTTVIVWMYSRRRMTAHSSGTLYLAGFTSPRDTHIQSIDTWGRVATRSLSVHNDAHAPVLPACVHRVTVYTKCKLIVSKHPTKLFNHIVHKPERCLHYLLPTARQQSVTDRLRSANKPPRVFAKTNRFKNSFVCYSLNSLQCEWCFYYLSSCVIQPSSCRITKIDWLIDCWP